MLQALESDRKGHPSTPVNRAECAWCLLQPVPGPSLTLLTGTDGLVVRAYTGEEKERPLCPFTPRVWGCRAPLPGGSLSSPAPFSEWPPALMLSFSRDGKPRPDQKAGNVTAASVSSSLEIGLLSLEPRWTIRHGLCVAPGMRRKRARETESLPLWVAQGRFLYHLLWAQFSKPWPKGRKRVNSHSLGPPWPPSRLGARRGSAAADFCLSDRAEG